MQCCAYKHYFTKHKVKRKRHQTGNLEVTAHVMCMEDSTQKLVSAVMLYLNNPNNYKGNSVKQRNTGLSFFLIIRFNNI